MKAVAVLALGLSLFPETGTALIRGSYYEQTGSRTCPANCYVRFEGVPSGQTLTLTGLDCLFLLTGGDFFNAVLSNPSGTHFPNHFIPASREGDSGRVKAISVHYDSPIEITERLDVLLETNGAITSNSASCTLTGRLTANQP